MPALNLIVIRSADIERMAAFYTTLGLLFTKHKHGDGPMHYASDDGGMVIELYPATEMHPPTTGLRLGFQVDGDEDVEGHLIPALKEKGGQLFSSTTHLVVMLDPDGHKVHLTKA